jgi:hypothetical protein
MRKIEEVQSKNIICEAREREVEEQEGAAQS